MPMRAQHAVPLRLGSLIGNRARGCYNGVMASENPGVASRGLSKVKNFLLLLLFLVIPLAGMFHPKIQRREDRDEKEIGDGV